MSNEQTARNAAEAGRGPSAKDFSLPGDRGDWAENLVDFWNDPELGPHYRAIIVAVMGDDNGEKFDTISARNAFDADQGRALVALLATIN